MNRNIIRLGLATVAMGTALMVAPNANAQFTGHSEGSAVRAAYSTVSVGGAAHSYALEVLNPDTVYTTGTYTLTLGWTGTNPDGAILNSAAMVATTAELAGSPLTFEGAVAGAINSAAGTANYENVEAMIEKFVGDDGATVTID